MAVDGKVAEVLMGVVTAHPNATVRMYARGRRSVRMYGRDRDSR